MLVVLYGTLSTNIDIFLISFFLSFYFPSHSTTSHWQKEKGKKIGKIKIIKKINISTNRAI